MERVLHVKTTTSSRINLRKLLKESDKKHS
jgi:hypothetical protein